MVIEVREWKQQREQMVEEDIAGRGVKDPRVLDAMRRVPRHVFVDKTYYPQAYNDYPLPIGNGQTISQPYMVASMTELLELKEQDSVLEIGTGSGYQTAVLALLCARVYTVERISGLSAQAHQRLDELGFRNITYMVGDGSLGWPQFAPYKGIIVTAGAPDIPIPLIDQLADRGRLVIPVGGEYFQVLNVVKKHKGAVVRKEMYGCTFVPLVGKESWENKK
jgi:protein-L-isoaspartate(D-aspartate) O-methyltransferase